MKRWIVNCLGLLCAVVSLHAQPKGDEAAEDLSYFLPKETYSYNANIPTPEKILGFPLGRQHADWGQVVSYMQALAAASDRVSVRETGRTYEYRPFIEVVITSAENQRNLDQIRAKHLSLTEMDQAASVDVSDMPVVVSLVASIHGNEPSGVNSTLAVAYFLAAAQGGDIDDILSHTVIVITPGANPDGINRFASWVNTTRSNTDVTDLNSREFQEPWPASRTNHYWADCNRDWLMTQHPEGQNGVDGFLYWMPNVLADLHEMGPDRSYYFSPGHPKRIHELISDTNQALAAEVSTYCAAELDKIGTLYYSKEGYDDFYLGKGAAYGDIHGAVCLLYEQGSSRGHLRETINGIRSFSWTIRNQAYGSYATIRAGYNMREKLLKFQQAFYANMRADAAKQTVKGYVFDTRGSKAISYHFLESMRHHQIDVYHLAKDVTVGSESFKAEDAYIIPMDQKFNPMIRTIMEDVHAFEDSIFYDISTWTFPYAYNLHYATLKSTAGLVGTQVTENTFLAGQIIGGKSDYGYVFSNTEFYTPKVMYELMKKGIYVQVSDHPYHFRSGNVEKDMGYGTLVVSAQNQPVSSDELYTLLTKLAEESGVTIYAAKTGLMDDYDLGSLAYHTLRLPKVAILVGQRMGIADSGEAWFLLDRRFQMQPTLIEATSTLTAAKLQRYNVIIMADGTPSLSKEAEEALKDWVGAGGTLIATGRANTWVNKVGLLSIKTKDTSFKEDSLVYRPFAEKQEARAGSTIDGVFLNCHLDRTHPLAWGFEQDEIPVMKRNSVIFQKDEDPYASPLYYTADPLLSGFLSTKNANLLGETPAVIAKRYKSGYVYVFADDMNFRSYCFGTSKLFMNAIFFGNCI